MERAKNLMAVTYYVLSYTLLTGVLNILRVDKRKFCKPLYGGHYPHYSNLNGEAVIQCQLCKQVLGENEMPKNYIPEKWEELILAKRRLHEHLRSIRVH